MGESNSKNAMTPDGTGCPTPSWLLRHRVMVPEPTPGYCEQGKLKGRCALTAQRLTLLMAPAGFGKTTLLATCCRDSIEHGVATAWLTLDREDGPAALADYLVFAFDAAGLDILASPRSHDTSLPYPQVSVLVRSLEARDRPCVLALDGLEQLTDPESVSVLSHLLRSAPPWLHVAAACRELPVGLDALDAVLGGGAQVLTAEDLRFSEGDIARFFDFKLSRRDLATVVGNSGGWPIALRISRNEYRRDDRETHAAKESLVVRDVIDNWIEGRFWDGVPDRDRDLILDVGLFDWMDEDLLEEVVQTPEALARIVRMPRIAGLLDRIGGSSDVYRLHPLLREHCAGRRRRTTPVRYQDLHRRIGKALARRGEIVAAMRHAAEAGDPDLAGGMLVEAGCLQWWMRNGSARLIAACRYLTDDVVAANPRLMLARSVVLMATARLGEARKHFADIPHGADHALGMDFELDWHIARGMLAVLGCEPVGSPHAMALVASARRCADMPKLPMVFRATSNWALCIYHNHRAEFESSLDRGRRVRRLGFRSAYLNVLVDFEFGQTAMARGEIKEAVKWYRSGQRAAKQLRRDPLAAHGDVLLRELGLERNRTYDTDDAGTGLWKDVYGHGAQFAMYAAASEVAVELTLESHGVDNAIGILDEMWEHARRMGLTTLERYLAAKYVSVLSDAGRIGEAERLWRTTRMPTADAGCVDLTNQTWREMEAVSGARLRMLTALGRYDAGRSLACDLISVASDRGLKRIWFRALALSTALEMQAGNEHAALAALEAYLELHAGSGYERPLVRLGDVAAGLLGRFVESDPVGAYADIAERLWLAVQRGNAEIVPRLTRKQRDVLVRLADQSDKEIANTLGLTVHGVRYHIRSIFRQLGVNDRAEAVRRAQSLGLLSHAEHARSSAQRLGSGP